MTISHLPFEFTVKIMKRYGENQLGRGQGHDDYGETFGLVWMELLGLHHAELGDGGWSEECILR